MEHLLHLSTRIIYKTVIGTAVLSAVLINNIGLSKKVIFALSTAGKWI